ncbi:SMP-30/gluconolactonase/LRE family protein [Shewanella salipaludis]|uniref:SMP-30/gluconolactonase/LRE family protein n=1 Tax=Shewanella salipaludis TaxID=2723052 RepID=A0A972FW44_9GAMM|nr:SMP-30/gluconolactonase/LRE family protein [Shewanella salipaludis]NMH64348.1 SMP-30/gluconolactonase/LRE family protein [Shewanella salipaludis]
MFSIAVDVRNRLGECPLWCERTRRLYWTDIEGSALLAFEEDNDVVMRWSLPERLGSFALTEKPGVLLMGLASRLGFYDLNTRIFTEVVSSPGTAGTRIGDGRCDRSGNFVFGTMDDGDSVQTIGQFHRLNAASLEVETLPLPEVAIPNSICFSPDGGTMYYCDSMQGRIFCCDYPSFENQRVFTETEGKGAPDGSCVDSQGYLWNAEWGGSRIVRYCPDGTIDCILPSPGIQTTCPTLAGEAFTTLYCTSANVGLSAPSRHDGALLKAETTVFSGLPESRFAAHRM